MSYEYTYLTKSPKTGLNRYRRDIPKQLVSIKNTNMWNMQNLRQKTEFDPFVELINTARINNQISKKTQRPFSFEKYKLFMESLEAESIPIIIIGAGGHAVSVANVALGSGMSVVAFVDDFKAGNDLLGIPVITKKQCVEENKIANLAIAIGDNTVRERVSNEYKSELPLAKFPSIIHHSAVIGINSKIGDGTVVMPLVNVGANCSVSDFCILNTSSSIDHDCEMKSFSSIAPRVITGGNVRIGVRSAISIGATIRDGIGVGDDTVIGANSYVNRAIGDNLVAYGNPCKSQRERVKGDAYLS
ncbi:NeuD/PglB/VioB family sugar acetyltransferase [Amylibacter sp.]|jgi:sugar O-acyltransferase (sialic acid O-acetyltransferase NeuD family)|nr:NeuD/PglB/VioB family sugar acetyltransferase [Amylibacter sp.]